MCMECLRAWVSETVEKYSAAIADFERKYPQVPEAPRLALDGYSVTPMDLERLGERLATCADRMLSIPASPLTRAGGAAVDIDRRLEALTRLGRELPMDELMQYWRDLVERWRVLRERCQGNESTAADWQAAALAWSAAERAWGRYEATKALRAAALDVVPMEG